MSVYNRIKSLSKEKKISINKLEQELDLSRGSLCKIDTNIPSAGKMQKIADYFGISVDFLMGREEEPEQPPLPVSCNKTPEITEKFDLLNDENKLLIERLILQLLQAQAIMQERSVLTGSQNLNQ